MANKLVILTGGFPFGKREPFVGLEIPYLKEKFDSVEIVSVNPDSKVITQNAYGTSISKMETHFGLVKKILGLRFLFSPIVLKELRIALREHGCKLNKKLVTTIILSYMKARTIVRHLEQQFQFTSQDIFFLYTYWCDDSAIALALLQSKYKGLRTVTRAHGWDLFFEVHELNYLPFRRLITDHLSAVLCISEIGKKYCLEKWKPSNTTNIHVARLGVEKAVFTEDSGDLILVSCAFLVPLKRVDLIIESLCSLKGLNVKWVHFGDGPEMQNLQQLAEKKIGINVKFEFKGYATREEILSWYQQHTPSLFISVSSSEGIPVSIMEAFSYGIPALATKVGGVPEIVNSANGVLLSSNPSAQAIANAIELFAKLPVDQKNELRKGAFNTWKTSFNAATNYRELANTISNL